MQLIICTHLAGEDYQDRTYVLTFAPGTTRLCREIPIIDNPPVEPPETFIVLIPPGPGIDVPPPATINIIDDGENYFYQKCTCVCPENTIWKVQVKYDNHTQMMSNVHGCRVRCGG